MIRRVRIGANMNKQDQDLREVVDQEMVEVDLIPTRATSAIYSVKEDLGSQISLNSFLAGAPQVGEGENGPHNSKDRIIKLTWRLRWRKHIMEPTGSSSWTMKSFASRLSQVYTMISNYELKVK